ncbi:MAG: motility protein A [Elusimicrobiales bacterium]
MDLGLIIGVVLAVGSIIGSFIWEGGKVSSLILGPAMLIIFGGTLAATMIGLPFKKFLEAWKVAMKALFEPKVDPEVIINDLVMACEKARREGLLALQKDVSKLSLPFAQKYMKMFINGTEPELIKEMAEIEMEYISERHNFGANIFNKMGGYSPTMGVIGTVMGLISTFSHAGGDPTALVHSIASAFIATYWGVLMANIFFLPIGDKLKNKHQEEMLIYSLVIEGIMAIEAGFSPRVLRTKLTSMLPISRQDVGINANKKQPVGAKA